MKNAEKLKKEMVPGRVYRRQELEGFSTAVDRDLKTLVDAGEVRKLGSGLYCRPKKNALGSEPPDASELVRAFLKTDDFLLTSYNHFTDLGLGLTQVHNAYVVYNHKRSGEFELGGRRFKFRVVPAFPKTLSKEYVLVDLMNHLKKLPDDVSNVRENLRRRAGEYDWGRVSELAHRYGSASAKRTLSEVHA